MEKQQARQIITDLFTNSFNRERYQLFLLNLLNRYEVRTGHYTGSYIPDAFKKHINQYWRIGKYVDPDGNQLDLLVVEVKSLAKLERARSSLRNFAVNRLKQFEKEASLIAFYAHDDGGSDWRFSYVKIEHEAYQDDTGKVKLKQELTPARRYSYLVGVHENSHTACKQLLPVLEMDYADPSIEEIEAAFSIEKITDEFFDQYKSLFQKLAEHLKKQAYFNRCNEEEIDPYVSRFAKKLLGQIVFLYFLQKKGWLGAAQNKNWGDGSKRFLREQFEHVAVSGGNFYRDFLQYLFYEALASERKDQKDSGYYERFQCRVPFLNGGLFEADYDWQNVKIEIPNNLFHNTEKTKAGDVGTGILDVFDRYNFTIKEDEPLEKEVAIDPEMLGKVFENMLDITERKSKGAFYTPREIVHYMCQESLIHYLDNRINNYSIAYQSIDSNQLNLFGGMSNKHGQRKLEIVREFGIRVPKEDLEILIYKGHLALENDSRVLSKGKETETYHFQLPEKIREHANLIDEALADIKICDPAIGSGAFPVGILHEIVTARQALALHSGNLQTAYELKRKAIADSIYGVDIDASAIDIARLRLWLSLIVDEDSSTSLTPLPNLDYKIIRGDTLLGLSVNKNLFNQELIKTLEQKKKEFHTITDHNQKVVLNQEIQSLFREISQGDQTFDFKLYFSEVWHDRGGFDLVIGNPPYVQIQKFSGQAIQNAWARQNYDTFTKTGDIYCLFYERGHQILERSGILTFISSNKWMRAAYGEKLRKFFAEKTKVLTLIDFSSFQVFDSATVDTCVQLLKKEIGTGSIQQACLIDSSFERNTPLAQYVNSKSIPLNNLSADSWVIIGKDEYDIKRRIETVGTPLKDWDVSINRGILTGLNEAFIIDGKKRAELIAKDPRSAEIIKPVLRGRDIKRYHIEFADLWFINTHNGVKGKHDHVVVSDYPAIKAHLDLFSPDLIKRQDKGQTPYNLRNCAYLEDFEKEKIVWADLSRSGNSFALDSHNRYMLNTGYIMTGENLKSLLGILNSEVILYYLDLINQKLDKNGWRWINQYVEKLPVPKTNKLFLDTISNIVDIVEVASINYTHLQSAFFQKVIDGLVYELYFTDEIRAAGKGISSHFVETRSINESISESEKLKIIIEEFNRLYDPRHPVRNIIETLDSVTVVRTIRQALKKNRE